MRIAAQRIAVQAAEEQVRLLRADVAQKSVALKARAQRRWLPAALLGAGGLLGFWLDRRLAKQGDSERKMSTTAESADKPSSSPVSPALSALATVSMLVKVWRDVAPIAEHFMQRRGSQPANPSSRAASTASESHQVPDAAQAQR